AGPDSMALRLRIPGWLQSSPTVKLNDKVLDASAAPGSYLTLRRVWKAGDKVEMRLPMHLHVEVMPDDSHMQAFLYGPLVLVGDLGAEGLTEAHIIGPNLRVGAPIPEQHGSPLGPVNRTPPVPDLEIPSFRVRSQFVDQGGRQAADIPDVGAAERCHAGSAEQPVRQALLGVLGSLVTCQLVCWLTSRDEHGRKRQRQDPDAP